MKIDVNLNTKAEEIYEALGYLSVTQYLKLLELIQKNSKFKTDLK